MILWLNSSITHKLLNSQVLTMTNYLSNGNNGHTCVSNSNSKQLTEVKKAQRKELRNAIDEAKKISSKQERKAWDSYYNWMKELDLDTVLADGYMYNGRPYTVTVRDCIPNAVVNAK